MEESEYSLLLDKDESRALQRFAGSRSFARSLVFRVQLPPTLENGSKHRSHVQRRKHDPSHRCDSRTPS